ncbi:MAG: Lnb N-terminal periplasmic domain-containing protein [Planctomycetota bacterium]|jgi:hypothetical protein
MKEKSDQSLEGKSRAEAKGGRAPLKKLIRMSFLSIALIAGFFAWAWSIPAIYFSNLPDPALRTAAAGLFGIGVPVAFLVLPNRRRTAVGFAVAFLVVLIWWNLIPASKDRDWEPEYAKLPKADIRGDEITVYNVRNFNYRTEEDFTPGYYDRTYRISELKTVDFVKSHWEAGEDVAHTILTFGFQGGEYLALSVETRRERDEPQSALRGLFKQYELIYVLGDERDLIRLRTNYRKEKVFLYPTTIGPEKVRVLFLDIIETINCIDEQPQFYNTLSHNCTTSHLPHLSKIGVAGSFDWRIILNGHTDERAYERGLINTDLSLEEARRHYHINQYVAGDPDPADFSRRIRPDLAGQ